RCGPENREQIKSKSRAPPQPSRVETAKNSHRLYSEEEENRERQATAPTPGSRWVGLNRQQQQANHAECEGKNGIGQQNPQPELVDRRPLVDRFTPENDHYACKSSKRDSDLRGRAKSFARFHS